MSSPPTLATLAVSNAARFPDVPALVERGRSFTYGEIGRLVEAASWHLQRLDVRPRDVVALAVRTRWQHLVLMLACFRMGATVCTFDPYQRAAERDAILAAIAPRLLLVDRVMAAPGPIEVCTVTEAWRELPAGAALPEAVENPALPGVLLTTSGSTGLPKIMPISQRAMLWRGSTHARTYRMRQGPRYLLGLPAVATAGTQVMIGQLAVGGTTYVLPAVHSPDEVLDLLLRERIQLATMVPTTIRWLIERATADGFLLPDMEMLASTGAPLFQDEINVIMQRVTPNLRIGYGATGAGGVASVTPQELRGRPGSVGRAWAGVTIQIVDGQGREVPAGDIGLIRVRSPGAASGYLDGGVGTVNDELFADGHVYTGDLGRLDHEGFLYLEGRASGIIIRAGQNLYPLEIERALLEHPAVAEAIVVGRPDPVLGEVPVAWLVLRSPVTTSELLAACRERLSPQKIPIALRVIDAMPLTPAGKADRGALAAAVREDPTANGAA